MHILKSDLALWELEHVQVDGPGMPSGFGAGCRGCCLNPRGGGSPPIQGLCNHVEGHRSPSALQLVEGVHPLLPQTGKHQTLMDTPLQVRLERLPDRGRDLKKDRFYHGLCPYLHDALSFAMAELPKREQAHPTFDTLYTLAKKLEAGQPACTCRYTTSSEAYREKHGHYLMPAGRVAALEEEGLALTDPVTGEDSESEVEAVGGLNVCLAQVMSRYQREE